MPTVYNITAYISDPAGLNGWSGGQAVQSVVATITDVNDDGQITSVDSIDGFATNMYINDDYTANFQNVGALQSALIQTSGNLYFFPIDGTTLSATDVYVSNGAIVGDSSVAISALCFAAGTRIMTPTGALPVEEIEIGDRVLTENGTAVRVKWLGRQSCVARHAQMVRIRAGALGHGLPMEDLTVTADHGMVLDGMVINASALVNGTTIDFLSTADLPERFTVYHIETEAHDIILANGAPSETFIDAAGRRAFDNYAEYLELYGAERIIPEMRLPRITSARLLPLDIQQRLSQAKDIDPMAQAV